MLRPTYIHKDKTDMYGHQVISPDKTKMLLARKKLIRMFFVLMKIESFLKYMLRLGNKIQAEAMIKIIIISLTKMSTSNIITK